MGFVSLHSFFNIIFILIDIFFDVDSKSTIGFRRSRHVVFESLKKKKKKKTQSVIYVFIEHTRTELF